MRFAALLAASILAGCAAGFHSCPIPFCGRIANAIVNAGEDGMEATAKTLSPNPQPKPGATPPKSDQHCVGHGDRRRCTPMPAQK